MPFLFRKHSRIASLYKPVYIICIVALYPYIVFRDKTGRIRKCLRGLECVPRGSESGLLCMLAYGAGGGGVFKAQRHVSVRWRSIYIHLLCCSQNMRPHYHDSTISRPICEVKHGQVWLVLAWGTSWEVQMLHICFAFFLPRVPIPQY